MEAIDLFAGAGGTDEGARALGIRPLGIELDDPACATREAAGHRTLQGDVAALDPQDFAPVRLCIGSPPCPTYSSAGKGAGRAIIEVVEAAARDLGEGRDTRAARIGHAYMLLEPRADWHHDPAEWPAPRKDRKRQQAEASPVRCARLARRDQLRVSRLRDAEMSMLVVEPLRWALALQPDYLAWEQVPPVLEFWELCASILGTLGYSTWTGVLSAEQYGVPQTRKRAILMASKVGEVKPPKPTHQRYVSPPKEDEDAPEGLFEVERADRIVRPEDRDLLPWISMAEALGWDGAIVNTRGDRKTEGGWVRFRGSNQENATVRDVEEPAPTIHFGHRANEVQWLYDRRQTGGDGTPVTPVPSSGPAPTLTAAGLAKGRDQWTRERPAPTIVTTRRSKDGVLVGRQLPEGEGENIGGHGWDSDGAESKPKAAGDAIRVSLKEALVLQSFRPDYPVQGTKSQRFLQIGNAVPPALAIPILGELLGIDWKPVLFDYLATYTQPVDLQEAA